MYLQIKKFRPEHRVLCRIATYSNRNTYEYRWNAQKERINLNQVEQWLVWYFYYLKWFHNQVPE